MVENEQFHGDGLRGWRLPLFGFYSICAYLSYALMCQVHLVHMNMRTSADGEEGLILCHESQKH
jgi:hypothetical protein